MRFLSEAQEASVPVSLQLLGVPVWGRAEEASRAAAGTAHRSVRFCVQGLRLWARERGFWICSSAVSGKPRVLVVSARASMRGPCAVSTHRGTQDLGGSSWDSEAELEFVPPQPTSGPDGGGAWRVDFKSQLGLNSAQLLFAEDTSRAHRHGAQRGAAPGPLSLRRSELDWFSIPGAVWPELRQRLPLPTCPERQRKFPDGPSSFG